MQDLDFSEDMLKKGDKFELMCGETDDSSDNLCISNPCFSADDGGEGPHNIIVEEGPVKTAGAGDYISGVVTEDTDENSDYVPAKLIGIIREGEREREVAKSDEWEGTEQSRSDGPERRRKRFRSGARGSKNDIVNNAK